MRKRSAPVKLPKATKRNLAAKQARDQKAGAMKDRRTSRGGSKNVFREDLTEADR
ncbi:MAG: hypothetical protein R2729_07150 [Bryobacteraceae bacterium]